MSETLSIIIVKTAYFKIVEIAICFAVFIIFKVYQKYDATQFMGVSPDITYSYYTPHGGASSHDFKWAVVTSQCSATCGTGKLKTSNQLLSYILADSKPRKKCFI